MNAVIDIGSNSVLLLIARRREDGTLEIERDEARIARLSEGVSATGRLSGDAIERTVRILADYRRIAAEADAPVQAVATEGLRMASNQEDFLLAAHRALGQRVRLISGEEEARLSYLSVARECEPDVALRVVDIGGASTELVSGRGESVESIVSHKVGSVRLTELHVHSDPILPSELAAIEAAATAALTTQPLEPADVVHGLAGTVTTVAALLLGLETYDRERVDGSQFAVSQIRSLRDELARQTQAQRSARPCLPAKRADVIVAGISILLTVLAHCGAGTLVVRDRGLRYALL